MPNREALETKAQSIQRDLRDKEGIIARLGVEIGSLSTFYSMERPTLGNLISLDTSREVLEPSDISSIRAKVRMADAGFEAIESYQILPSAGCRQLAVSALEPSYLMDSVLRFVFPLNRVRQVSIGARIIPWARRNHYHQFKAEPASVLLHDGSRISFHPAAQEVPEGMALHVYFRDEPDAWVFHIRMLAINPTHRAVRGCHRWYNRPLPPFFQKTAGLIPGFLNGTLYIRERWSQRIPFQTNGAILLEKGQTLRFSVDWEIQS